MGKTGSSKQMKRSTAPPFWKITRKEHRFISKPSPGPHPIKESYPLATLLRDVLKVVKTMRDAESVINSGKVAVDGVIRKDKHFPVGLMDVISIPSLNKIFRLLPAKNTLLYPVEIDAESAKIKLCKVKTKKKIRLNRFAYGLHDSRTFFSKEDLNAKIGDSLLISIPDGKVLSKVALDSGSQVIFLKGKSLGKLGVIRRVHSGHFSAEKMAEVEVEGEVVKVPVKLLLAVGVDKPILPLVMS
ncbi:MAG: 30S ribosomal protein S4e [Nitrososphaeria archaeon]